MKNVEEKDNIYLLPKRLSEIFDNESIPENERKVMNWFSARTCGLYWYVDEIDREVISFECRMSFKEVEEAMESLIEKGFVIEVQKGKYKFNFTEEERLLLEGMRKNVFIIL